MSNAYSDAYHDLKQKKNRDESIVKLIYKHIGNTNVNKQLVLQLLSYGTTEMVINTINLCNTCKSWEEYCNIYTPGKTISPYSIQHLLIKF